MFKQYFLDGFISMMFHVKVKYVVCYLKQGLHKYFRKVKKKSTFKLLLVLSIKLPNSIFKKYLRISKSWRYENSYKYMMEYLKFET